MNHAYNSRGQAENDLSDKSKREDLDAAINQARTLTLKALNLPTSTSNTDAKVQALTPPFKAQVRAQVKLLLIDEELRRRKYVTSSLVMALYQFSLTGDVLFGAQGHQDESGKRRA